MIIEYNFLGQTHPCMVFQCNFCEIRGRERKAGSGWSLEHCQSECLKHNHCLGIDIGNFGECYHNYDDVRVVGTKGSAWFKAYRKEPYCGTLYIINL